jgi:hypothetical protein
LIKPGALQLDIDKQGFKSAHLTIEALPGIVTDVVVDPSSSGPSIPSPSHHR